MATGCSEAATSVYAEDESLICSLCLEVFRTPKILPCFHTFCEHCLQTLVKSRKADKFPCPHCREEIKVPLGGVSAFTSNFYLQPEDLDRARNSIYCKKHPRKELEIYCYACDVLICTRCHVDSHKMHDVEFVSEAKTKLQSQLRDARPRLTDLSLSVQINIDKLKKDLHQLKEQKSDVKKAILNRHAKLQEHLDHCRDEAVELLLAGTNEVKRQLVSSLVSQQEELKQLTKLQRQLTRAVDGETEMSELMTVAREMRSGRGSEESVQKLTRQMNAVYSPSFQHSTAPLAPFELMRDYIGSVTIMETAPEVTVVEKLIYKKRIRRVCYLCLLDDGNLVFLYDIDDHLPPAGVTVDCLMKTPEDIPVLGESKGRCLCFTPYLDGWPVISKSRVDVKLADLSDGSSIIYREVVISRNPFQFEERECFNINNSHNRAFDVDASERLFVVLQESQTPDTQRTVRLYRHSKPDAIHTYNPPVEPFQPSDVCFYRLGGQEVLLVADELNHAIHVVKVQDGRLSFARYLAPGCPLLVQPTALNTDIDGRLWVACKGGRILTCTPEN